MENLVMWSVIGVVCAVLVLLFYFVVLPYNKKKEKKRVEAKRKEEARFVRVQTEALEEEMAKRNQRRVENKIRREEMNLIFWT